MFEKLLWADDLRSDISHITRYVPGEKLGVKEVVLCHAVDVPKDMPVDRVFFSRMEVELEKRADALGAYGIKCVIELVRGEPGRAILELAEKHNVSMIVVGSHHRGGLRGSLIGSVSYSILHETVRPTFVIRMSHSDKIKNVTDILSRHIFYPTDFSETAEAAFLLLEQIATVYHSRVTLFHVHDKARIDPYLRHMLPEFDKEDKARLQRLKEHLESNGAGPVNYQVSYGVPAQRILQLANSGEYSLVIMGCQGRGFIPEIYLGSTANAVARCGEIPVIFVPNKRAGVGW